jgi:hypothetical protein
LANKQARVFSLGQVLKTKLQSEIDTIQIDFSDILMNVPLQTIKCVTLHHLEEIVESNSSICLIGYEKSQNAR